MFPTSLRRFLRLRLLLSLLLLLGLAQMTWHISGLRVSLSRDDSPSAASFGEDDGEGGGQGRLKIPELLSFKSPFSSLLPPSKVIEKEEKKPESEWCQEDECTTGAWMPRTPLFSSLPDLQAHYATSAEPVWSGCRIPDKSLSDDPTNGISEEERQEKMGKRLVDVMNWVWVPQRGKMREWDVEEVVVRLLRSAGGIILIGDSITEQHFHALGYAFRRSGLQFHEDPPHLPLYNHKNVHQWILRNNTPLAHKLIAKAGVPASRLARPLFSFLEEHMLIGEEEIREITALYGAPKEHYPWYHDFQRVEGWEEFVARAVEWRVEDAEERGLVVEDSVVVLNTGAHWSRHEYTMLPTHDSHEEQQKRLELTFKQMMRRVRTRLSPLPHLTIIYRPTSPGHPQCHLRTSPYPSLSSARAAELPGSLSPRLLLTPNLSEEEKLDRIRWDWDRFEVHNELWRESIRKMGVTRERLGLDGARWVYLDVWGMGLMRPDAHALPGVDCLHWCLPGMLEEWNKQIYQLIIPIEGLDAEV